MACLSCRSLVVFLTLLTIAIAKPVDESSDSDKNATAPAAKDLSPPAEARPTIHIGGKEIEGEPAKHEARQDEKKPADAAYKPKIDGKKTPNDGDKNKNASEEKPEISEPLVKEGPLEPSIADVFPMPVPLEPNPVEDVVGNVTEHPANVTLSPSLLNTTKLAEKPHGHGVRKVNVLNPGLVDMRVATTDGIRICTWNVFRFGKSKFKRPDPFVKKYGKEKIGMMCDQICQCDILAMQEYFDASLEVMETLISAVKQQCGQWDYVPGPRVGRVSKEQYVFLYRSDLAKVVGNDTYPEPAGKDIFSREPFFAKFKINKPGLSFNEIVLGTIHTEPDSAVEEMNGLVDTFDWAKKKFGGCEDVIVLGDYNGDCQYVRKSDWANVKLFTNKDFSWFIPTGTDTASMNSECSFDRAVTKSPKLKASYRGALKVLDFVSQYKIDVKEARQLSDHFPVSLVFH